MVSGRILVVAGLLIALSAPSASAATESGIRTLERVEDLSTGLLGFSEAACRMTATGDAAFAEVMTLYLEDMQAATAQLSDGDDAAAISRLRAPAQVSALSQYEDALATLSPFVDFAGRGELPNAYLQLLFDNAAVAYEQSQILFDETQDVFALQRVTRFESETMQNIARIEERIRQIAILHCAGSVGVSAAALAGDLTEARADIARRIATAEQGNEMELILAADPVTANAIACLRAQVDSVEQAVDATASVEEIMPLATAAEEMAHMALIATEARFNEMIETPEFTCD